MLEDLGGCTGNKHTEALVQSDIRGEDLNNRNSDNNQCLSGKFWSDELNDAANNLKQLETKQTVEERLDSRQDIKAGLIAAAKAKEELQLMLNDEMFSGKLSRFLKEQSEIIDCGFGRAFERQGKAESDESARRLRMIELAPLFWNSLDSRR